MDSGVTVMVWNDGHKAETVNTSVLSAATNFSTFPRWERFRKQDPNLLNEKKPYHAIRASPTGRPAVQVREFGQIFSIEVNKCIKNDYFTSDRGKNNGYPNLMGSLLYLPAKQADLWSHDLIIPSKQTTVLKSQVKNYASWCDWAGRPADKLIWISLLRE